MKQQALAQDLLIRFLGLGEHQAVEPKAELLLLGGKNGTTCQWRYSSPMYHWIGLREKLQETMVFTIKYRAFL